MTNPQSPATAGGMSFSDEKRWLLTIDGKPTSIDITDSVRAAVKAELTSLLVKQPEKKPTFWSQPFIKGETKEFTRGYNQAIDDSRAVIQEAITAVEEKKV